MTDDHTQARLQRIEKRIASLDDTVGILAKVGDAPAKQRMADAFSNDPSMAIIYYGIRQRVSQVQIAAALRARQLPRADQADVSRACSQLEDRGFLKKEGKKGFATLDGWDAFGIDKFLKNVLRTGKVDPLG